jgi:hexosaminidase
MYQNIKLNLKRSFLFILMSSHFLFVFSCSKDDGPTKEQITIKRVSIIPEPTSVTHGLYNIEIPKGAAISRDIIGTERELLTATLSEVIGSTASADNESAFIRIYKDNTLDKEGYRITVEDDGCSIFYNAPEGLLWGIQTMRQVLLQYAVSGNGVKSIPLLTLEDAPKNVWRGFHLDLARHMFTMDYLKKVVDVLSFYKINKMQLHLTDDQGWRIQINQYPPLTEIGGWRTFDEYDKRLIERTKTDQSFKIDSRFIRGTDEYGGFYTQAELKEFIDYATKRGIEVIPEIDMPGHFTAAISAYKDLSCLGTTGWGSEFSDPICAGKTENYPMLKNIIKEVADLFPSKYFHIGGDEVEKARWKECPRCQALIKEKGLNGVDGLQNYFIKEMADYTRSLDKEVMAWDDAFIQSDPQNLLYTYWRDWLSDQPAKITQAGYQLVFMEWGRFYLSADPSDQHLKSLYEFQFQPQFKGIVESNVIGFQACIWTEMIPNETKLGHHLFPALQAFSEVAWGSQRNWSRFQERIPWHLSWLEKSGFATRKPGF